MNINIYKLVLWVFKFLYGWNPIPFHLGSITHFSFLSTAMQIALVSFLSLEVLPYFSIPLMVNFLIFNM